MRDTDMQNMMLSKCDKTVHHSFRLTLFFRIPYEFKIPIGKN